MCLYGGVEKFERIKTKRVTSDTKNLIHDEILVSVQLKKISRQWSSPQFWSGEAQYFIKTYNCWKKMDMKGT